jgi:hypothetical protein
MSLPATVFLVLVAWTVLAIPVALVVGRFLRAGSAVPERANGSRRRNSFGRAA